MSSVTHRNPRYAKDRNVHLLYFYCRSLREFQKHLLCNSWYTMKRWWGGTTHPINLFKLALRELKPQTALGSIGGQLPSLTHIEV